jgi:hypothetical protein
MDTGCLALTSILKFDLSKSEKDACHHAADGAVQVNLLRDDDDADAFVTPFAK